MKDEGEMLRRLGEAAQTGEVPRVDVVSDVMAAIRQSTAPAGSEGEWAVLGWIAGLSVAAAGVMIPMAVNAWTALSDPLASISFQFPWEMLT